MNAIEIILRKKHNNPVKWLIHIVQRVWDNTHVKRFQVYLTREGTCQSLQSRALSLDVDSKQWLNLNLLNIA